MEIALEKELRDVNKSLERLKKAITESVNIVIRRLTRSGFWRGRHPARALVQKALTDEI